MLTYSQTVVAAFIGDGAVYHADCAREHFGTLTTEKAEAGLTNAYGLSPLIQYQVDEWAGEDAYELAEERADEWERDHPQLAALLGVSDEHTLAFVTDPDAPLGQRVPLRLWADRNRARLIDRLADRFADIAGPTCDICGKPIN